MGEEAGHEVAMGTFHALCARVLRRDGKAIGLDPHFVVYDSDDQQSLMKQVLKDEDLPITGEYKPSAILGAISRAKNEMLDADFIAANAHTHREREIARLFRRYQSRLKAANALDFDDLLLEAVRLFHDAPSVLERYQGRWRYLHVDEYQDTNRPQYLWVKYLAAAHKNLCVVGDDDQSIYSWRGADIRNILDFEGDYPDAAVVKLEQNYRSTQLILDAAHAVVTHNSARKDKKLWTEIAGGKQISRFEAYNEEEEAEWIARQVEELTGTRSSILTRRADEDAESWSRSDIAVMYRTNAQSRAIEEAFLRYGIRYQLVGGTRFYQRREVKDALAYLRILRSDTDQISFERVLNVPQRGIGEKTIEELRATAAGGRTIGAEGPAGNEETATYWRAIVAAGEGRVPTLGSRARTALGGFATLVARLRTRIGVLALPEMLDAVLEESGYRAMLADGSEDGEERWANLLELRSVTTRYDDLSPDDALDRFLEETALVADQDSYETGADAVTMITLHAAKGLEFPIVFIAGLEEGVFPHSRSLDDEKQLEEERRLAYVGITRAKRRLFLSHAARRATWGQGGLSVPEPFPLRDTRRTHDRAAARARRCLRRRLWRRRSRHGLRASTRQQVRDAHQDRRRRLPPRQRAGRGTEAGRGIPPQSRPGSEARGVRRGRPVGQSSDATADATPGRRFRSGRAGRTSRRLRRRAFRSGRGSPESASSATATVSATPDWGRGSWSRRNSLGTTKK